MKTARRFFWGNSLPQAVMAAARHHGVDPNRLDYRIYEKRHGFVKHPRSVVIEVDPERPERAPLATGESLQTTALPKSSPAKASAEPAGPSVANPARVKTAASRPPRRPPVDRTQARGAVEESWDRPDEDSAVAAAAAMRALLAFAGLDLEPQVRIEDERLEVELLGDDAGGVAKAGGLDLLEQLDTLLPRAIRTLSGRTVRVRTDWAGLRALRVEGLLADARRIASRVAETRQAEALPPMSASERRAIHVELAEHPSVETESVGSGSDRHLVIQPRSSGKHDDER